MKCFHLMVPEEINISVQKALTFKYEVQRDRMEFAECPFAEDRMLTPTYLCHRRISCCLPPVPFNKNTARIHCKTHPESGYWARNDHSHSINCRTHQTYFSGTTDVFLNPCLFSFSRCPNNDKARVILKKKKKKVTKATQPKYHWNLLESRYIWSLCVRVLLFLFLPYLQNSFTICSGKHNEGKWSSL